MGVFNKIFKVFGSIKSFLIKNKTGLIIGIIAALIASLIFDIPRYVPLIREDPSSEVVEKLLDFSESIDVEDNPIANELTSALEKNSKEQPMNIGIWLYLGQWYAASNKYRKALYCYTRAFEIDSQIADSYYATGNVYYELALIDLVRKKRFKCDSNKLICTFEPDEQSKVLFRKALDEYNQAENYPTLWDSDPKVMFTSLYIVGHRKNQIKDFFEGSSTISLHRLEILRLNLWVRLIYPENKKLIDETEELTEDLLDYVKEHPEEFPYFSLPK